MTSQGQICRSYIIEKYRKFNFTRFLREIDPQILFKAITRKDADLQYHTLVMDCFTV